MRDNPITLEEALDYDSRASGWRFIVTWPIVGRWMAGLFVGRTLRRYRRYLGARVYSRTIQVSADAIRGARE